MFLFLFACIAAVSGEFQVQIIHNNDLHARFEETNTNAGPCSEEQARQGQCYGGIARIKTVIKRALDEANSQGIPTIVVNAGDFFHGTPYYRMSDGRCPTI